MPFDVECSEYIGKRMFVLPYYGCGWGYEDGSPTAGLADSIGPEPFHLVLDTFIYRQGQIVGGIGKIREAQHKYDGMWGAFCLRMLGNYNFTTTPGEFMIWIGRDRPVAKADFSDAVYRWIELGTASPKLSGYGTVAASKEFVKDVYDTAMKTRKNVFKL